MWATDSADLYKQLEAKLDEMHFGVYYIVAIDDLPRFEVRPNPVINVLQSEGNLHE